MENDYKPHSPRQSTRENQGGRPFTPLTPEEEGRTNTAVETLLIIGFVAGILVCNCGPILGAIKAHFNP